MCEIGLSCGRRRGISQKRKLANCSHTPHYASYK
ncbi:hypothetical protein T03_1074 [Trichinella britovi]|uniref:Uncharacterized protein n=1 Tax=Trichinella britovi TaxID=45882 RepID=A0A0V0ZF46_TRIBR|nr:hypothetical protein T03_1074 [Trichinella britovi]